MDNRDFLSEDILSLIGDALRENVKKYLTNPGPPPVPKLETAVQIFGEWITNFPTSEALPSLLWDVFSWASTLTGLNSEMAWYIFHTIIRAPSLDKDIILKFLKRFGTPEFLNALQDGSLETTDPVLRDIYFGYMCYILLPDIIFLTPDAEFFFILDKCLEYAQTESADFDLASRFEKYFRVHRNKWDRDQYSVTKIEELMRKCSERFPKLKNACKSVLIKLASKYSWPGALSDPENECLEIFSLIAEVLKRNWSTDEAIFLICASLACQRFQVTADRETELSKVEEFLRDSENFPRAREYIVDFLAASCKEGAWEAGIFLEQNPQYHSLEVPSILATYHLGKVRNAPPNERNERIGEFREWLRSSIDRFGTSEGLRTFLKAAIGDSSFWGLPKSHDFPLQILGMNQLLLEFGVDEESVNICRTGLKLVRKFFKAWTANAQATENILSGLRSWESFATSDPRLEKIYVKALAAFVTNTTVSSSQKEECCSRVIAMKSEISDTFTKSIAETFTDLESTEKFERWVFSNPDKEFLCLLYCNLMLPYLLKRNRYNEREAILRKFRSLAEISEFGGTISRSVADILASRILENWKIPDLEAALPQILEDISTGLVWVTWYSEDSVILRHFEESLKISGNLDLPPKVWKHSICALIALPDLDTATGILFFKKIPLAEVLTCLIRKEFNPASNHVCNVFYSYLAEIDHARITKQEKKQILEAYAVLSEKKDYVPLSLEGSSLVGRIFGNSSFLDLNYLFLEIEVACKLESSRERWKKICLEILKLRTLADWIMKNFLKMVKKFWRSDEIVMGEIIVELKSRALDSWEVSPDTSYEIFLEVGKLLKITEIPDLTTEVVHFLVDSSNSGILPAAKAMERFSEFHREDIFMIFGNSYLYKILNAETGDQISCLKEFLEWLPGAGVSAHEELRDLINGAFPKFWTRFEMPSTLLLATCLLQPFELGGEAINSIAETLVVCENVVPEKWKWEVPTHFRFGLSLWKDFHAGHLEKRALQKHLGKFVDLLHEKELFWDMDWESELLYSLGWLSKTTKARLATYLISKQNYLLFKSWAERHPENKYLQKLYKASVMYILTRQDPKIPVKELARTMDILDWTVEKYPEFRSTIGEVKALALIHDLPYLPSVSNYQKFLETHPEEPIFQNQFREMVLGRLAEIQYYESGIEVLLYGQRIRLGTEGPETKTKDPRDIGAYYQGILDVALVNLRAGDLDERSIFLNFFRDVIPLLAKIWSFPNFQNSLQILRNQISGFPIDNRNRIFQVLSELLVQISRPESLLEIPVRLECACFALACDPLNSKELRKSVRKECKKILGQVDLGNKIREFIPPRFGGNFIFRCLSDLSTVISPKLDTKTLASGLRVFLVKSNSDLWLPFSVLSRWAKKNPESEVAQNFEILLNSIESDSSLALGTRFAITWASHTSPLEVIASFQVKMLNHLSYLEYTRDVGLLIFFITGLNAEAQDAQQQSLPEVKKALCRCLCRRAGNPYLEECIRCALLYLDELENQRVQFPKVMTEQIALCTDFRKFSSLTFSRHSIEYCIIFCRRNLKCV
jgi:hypothetical protein